MSTIISITKKQLEENLAGILLHSDGSTTRMLEYYVKGKLDVDVFCNKTVSCKELPLDIRQYFDDGDILQRKMSLRFKNDVISDNIVFARVDSLIENGILEKLYEGRIPLGKLINNSETRRELLWSGYEDLANIKALFYPMKISEETGVYPVKKYLIIRNGQVWFYICELFRMNNVMNYYWQRKV